MSLRISWVAAFATTLPLALSLTVLGCDPRSEASAQAPRGELADVQSNATVEPHLEVEVYDRVAFLEIRISGQPLGGVTTRLSRRDDGSIVLDDETRISILRENSGVVDQFDSIVESRTIYDPKLRLVSETELKLEAGIEERTEVRIEGNELVYKFEGPGRKSEERHPLPEDFASSREVFEDLKARFEGAPIERHYRSFSTEREDFEHRTTKLLEKKTLDTVDGPTEAYRLEESDEDGEQVEAWVDADYMTIEADMFGTITVARVERDVLENQRAGKLTSEIEGDGTLQNWYALESMKVRFQVVGDNPEAPPVFEDSIYQDVQREGDTYVLTLKDTRPRGPTPQKSLPVTAPQDVARFLEATAMSQSDDPKVIAQAKAIVGEESEPLMAAVKIANWVNQRLAKKGGARGSATAVEVLDSLEGDCTEHAVLTVAMMRAVGIPARNVDGIVYATDAHGNGIAGYHAWSEIWVGQWIGVDAMFGEVGTTAHYLHLGYDEPGEPSSSGRMGRTFGVSKIKVLEYRTFGGETTRLR